MARDKDAKFYSLGEEIAHAVTHGIGGLLAAIGMVVLIVQAVRFGDPWRVIASVIYGTSLVLLYTTSTLYHALPPRRAKRVFQLLDHAAIYLLIAGSYTPFALVTLRGGWGWTLFGLAWGLGFAGIIFEVVFRERAKKLSLVFYLLMGWLAVIAGKPLLSALPPGGILLIVSGGAFYSLGTIFYVWRRLPYHHAIWHVFVLGGSAAHFFCMLFYVVTAGA